MEAILYEIARRGEIIREHIKKLRKTTDLRTQALINADINEQERKIANLQRRLESLAIDDDFYTFVDRPAILDGGRRNSKKNLKKKKRVRKM